MRPKSKPNTINLCMCVWFCVSKCVNVRNVINTHCKSAQGIRMKFVARCCKLVHKTLTNRLPRHLLMSRHIYLIWIYFYDRSWFANYGKSRTPDGLTDWFTKWMDSCAPFVAYTNWILHRDCCCKTHWVFEKNFMEFKTVSQINRHSICMFIVCKESSEFGLRYWNGMSHWLAVWMRALECMCDTHTASKVIFVA